MARKAPRQRLSRRLPVTRPTAQLRSTARRVRDPPRRQVRAQRGVSLRMPARRALSSLTLVLPRHRPHRAQRLRRCREQPVPRARSRRPRASPTTGLRDRSSRGATRRARSRPDYWSCDPSCLARALEGDPYSGSRWSHWSPAAFSPSGSREQEPCRHSLIPLVPTLRRQCLRREAEASRSGASGRCSWTATSSSRLPR